MNSPHFKGPAQAQKSESEVTNRLRKFTRVFTPIATLALLSTHSVVSFAADIADVPLSVVSGADPNILFVLDDSGSMQREVTPEVFSVARTFPVLADNLYGGSDTQEFVAWPFADEGQTQDARATAIRFRSVTTNASYYNPAVTYTPWVSADGTPFPDADPEAAPHNPARPGKGVRNLTVEQSDFATYTIVNDNGQLVGSDTETATYFPARYYYFTGNANDDRTDPNNYVEVEIKPENGPFLGHGRGGTDAEGNANRPDCSLPNGCTYAEEIQNFANWYSYYRSRLLASQATIGLAFNQLPETVRVGFGTINHNGSVDGMDGDTVVQGVRAFNAQNRESFYDQLYNRSFSNRGTPLRRALKGAGNYFERADDRGPWSDSPGESGNTNFLSCRKSFTILMTDGFWNGGNPSVGNLDGTPGDTISGPKNEDFTYTPANPFEDDFGNTLADVAMNYWKRDLLPGTDNLVPTNDLNPAFWQHMVTFGVAFGVEGNVDPRQAFDAIDIEGKGNNGATITWEDPTSANDDADPSKIDDLLHAAVNSRGGFFSAAEPNAFGEELSDVLSSIIDRSSTSASSAPASASVLNADTVRFVASFRGDDWSGDLRSENIETGNLNWSATQELSQLLFMGNDPNNFPAKLSERNVLTLSPTGQGQALTFSGLSADQQTALNTNLEGNPDGKGLSRLEWLLGSETADPDFRSRVVNEGGGDTVRLIGDIVNSNPQIERQRNFGFGLLEGYNEYRSRPEYQNRQDVVYVGANDGFLHGFQAQDGKELLAYMPSELLTAEGGGNDFAPVNRLMDPEYEHRFFVDGTPTISDARIDIGSGAEWRTLLVGTMGVGGRTVFALDITNPAALTPDKVLWEFTDPDLQRGVARAQVGLLASGEWAAIFGNGREGDAKLFVVNLETGNLIKKLDVGSQKGLSTPTLTVKNNRITQVYAGTIDGGLWRFDLSSSNTQQWNSEKLFQTEAPNGGDAQPITARPRVSPHPTNPDINVISFGTGAFFRDSDRGNVQIQTLYGIFDDDAGSSGITRDDLREQVILEQTTETVDVKLEDGTTFPIDFEVRRVSQNEVNDGQEGWYLDLVFPAGPSGIPTGERVVSPATFPSGFDRDRVRFSSLVPSSGACSSGVEGWLMELSTATGGQLQVAPFDLNQDGKFDENVSGLRNLISGETLTTVRTKEGRDKIVDPNPDGPLGKLPPGIGGFLDGGGGIGRQSWEEFE